MKINEVEALAGITKKNIRFYEEQGLLSPRRNSENGYRDYGEEEVAILKRIKLLRKLGVPIEEIRQMFTGTHTVGDGMRRHLITLEREKRNLEQSIRLCEELRSSEIPVGQLDTEAILAKMDELERGGTTFQNSQADDIRVQYTAPIIVTVLMVLISAGLDALMIWAYINFPQDSPPVWFIGILIVIFSALGVGAVAALIQRIQEIGKGELNDAKRY